MKLYFKAKRKAMEATGKADTKLRNQELKVKAMQFADEKTSCKRWLHHQALSLILKIK